MRAGPTWLACICLTTSQPGAGDQLEGVTGGSGPLEQGRQRSIPALSDQQRHLIRILPLHQNE